MTRVRMPEQFTSLVVDIGVNRRDTLRLVSAKNFFYVKAKNISSFDISELRIVCTINDAAVWFAEDSKDEWALTDITELHQGQGFRRSRFLAHKPDECAPGNQHQINIALTFVPANVHPARPFSVSGHLQAGCVPK